MSLRRSQKTIKKHQIEIAMEMLMTSMTIFYGYIQNKHHTITEHDLEILDLFADELHRHHCSTSFTAHCLHLQDKYKDILH